MVGLTPDAERNLQDVFYAVLENDMRPLLKLGMPKGEWYDTSTLLTQIVDGGFMVQNTPTPTVKTPPLPLPSLRWGYPVLNVNYLLQINDENKHLLYICIKEFIVNIAEYMLGQANQL